MIRWRGDEFLRLTKEQAAKGMVKGGLFFTSSLRKDLNTSQPYTRTATGKHIGSNPSAPGQFPHKLSGQLQRSIGWKFDKVKMVLTVGTNLKGYPKYLQTGTKRMRPRPWLTLGWKKYQGRIGKLICGKV